MLLWIIFAAMSGLAVLTVLLPLSRARRTVRSEAAGDIAVYRDQLAAIDEEVARGVVGGKEAEAARAEISRRLLKAAEREEKQRQPVVSSPRSSWRIASGLALGMVALTLAGYLTLGSPELPGQPLAARQAAAPSEDDPQMLLARVEAYLRENPEDGNGWDVLAPVYMEQGRFADAARAYGNAVRLLGANAERLASLGQALTHAEEGMVTAAARDAFKRALALDPGMLRARFYLALALEQEGSLREAAEAWRALHADAPADAPWRVVVAQHLAAVGERLGEAAPGPGAEDMRAAEAMPADERDEMIEQMVAGLAERLEAGGGDAEEWVMLMRSHAALGRKAEARRALAKARDEFAENPAALETLDGAAKSLGLIGQVSQP